MKMKVCEKCGEEIFGKDGENLCANCDGKKKKAKRNAARKSRRDEIMRSLGMTKVRGALGGTYWE
jgi:uncharacterized Zn finger protein (UPF0148 family)